jgi:pyruvate/2-oxoacid:ferredoxin oxidoreductase alpha subunit
MERVFDALTRIGEDFERTFGRPGLSLFEAVGWPADGNADIAVVGMGPDFGTFEEMRAAYQARTGTSLAGLAIRLLTPFPREQVKERLKGAKVVLVVNQAHHSGRGHLTLDVVDALSDLPNPPRVVSVFAGIGGADVSEATWAAMLDSGRTALAGVTLPPYQLFHEGVRL